MNREVYHGSPVSNLKVINPHRCVVEEPLLYASYDFAAASLFLREPKYFVCIVGRGPSKAFVIERFKGAFDYQYSGHSGSVYTLPADTFSKDWAMWNKEVVSESSVRPIGELFVRDASEYLRNLAESGSLRIYEYPDRSLYIPKDDSDLIKMANLLRKVYDEKDLNLFKSLHPQLFERMEENSND